MLVLSNSCKYNIFKIIIFLCTLVFFSVEFEKIWKDMEEKVLSTRVKSLLSELYSLSFNNSKLKICVIILILLIISDWIMWWNMEIINFLLTGVYFFSFSIIQKSLTSLFFNLLDICYLSRHITIPSFFFIFSHVNLLNSDWFLGVI